jgi:hypothetical protein
MALAEVIDISEWIGKDIDATRQSELVSCIAAAQSWIATEAGLRSLEKEATAKIEYLDGDTLPNQEEAWLPNSCRPTWHTGTGADAIVVSENGIVLGMSFAYTTGTNIVIDGANTFRRMRLYRSGGWSTAGKQNIAVTLKCGFDPSLTAPLNPLPVDVKRLVMGVAWKLFNAPTSVGRSSVSKAGQAVSWLDELSAMERSTLDSLRGI